jgi:hypothetical protein
MTCAELELQLCDYIDGALSPEASAAVEAHFSACGSCAELARDGQAALGFLARVPEVETPRSLVTRILQQVPVRQNVPEKAKNAAAGLLGRWFRPVLQPRFVMGMAMTILSFAMLGRFAGIEARQLRPGDLNPVKVWEAAEDKLHQNWVRVVKYYESLRFVYEIQSMLREFTESDEQQAQQEETELTPRKNTSGKEVKSGQ